jgi:transposase-like protein
MVGRKLIKKCKCGHNRWRIVSKSEQKYKCRKCGNERVDKNG